MVMDCTSAPHPMALTSVCKLCHAHHVPMHTTLNPWPMPHIKLVFLYMKRYSDVSQKGLRVLQDAKDVMIGA